ncbi:hypothetical protein GCM10011391_18140 [Pullulanibacillus camelliae]|uniref:Uncharacterized protein n=1 Tax=Pullulanibacillus camelliae TaxID=1707096 RepID=A0A8J2VW80_9BACL|nr:hypothetical protein [Pullulanibacillus camelliae]GGE39688.1 hypothetical protein GCM10011391_18140 [Pullulanibacillus camelliae]
MKAGVARMLAKEWTLRHVAENKDILGAYLIGSTSILSDKTALSPDSDVDIMIVMANEIPSMKLGKFVFKGCLLEVSFLSSRQLESIERVLSSYHLANSLRFDTIIYDPVGELHHVQKAVADHFTEKKWVLKRCDDAMHRIVTGMHSIGLKNLWYDQVMAWLFSTGVTTHVLLVAALKNPTIRRRYVAVRDVLSDYGLNDFYHELLQLLGCQSFTKEQVSHYLVTLTETFDATVSVSKTPFFFSSDITLQARALAIDGSWQLIHSGNHLEAVFWIVATFTRCHKILAVDAPELEQKRASAFHKVTNDLGLMSRDSIIRRARQVCDFIPKLRSVAEEIMERNQDVRKGRAPHE